MLRTLGILTLTLVIGLVIGALVLLNWVNARITHVDALSGAANTDGMTYLIVGSDSRDGWDDDGTEGARTDTIMLLHQPVDGPVALISIPRDSYVEIPGHDASKINASFAWGGAPLLVETVEQLTGLTVDHYVEIGFGGVVEIVDAVGGVELCLDYDVSDRLSRLNWTAGCHQSDGATALAFARMRYADPEGDIGRTARQQQVVSSVAEKVLEPGVVFNPFKAIPLMEAGLGAVALDQEADALDLARFALAFNAARGGEAVHGTPPLASLDHRVNGSSTVLLDPDEIDQFWDDIAQGAYEPGAEVGGTDDL